MEEPQYQDEDTTIVKYHINQDGELDYTIYHKGDGGVLSLDEHSIEELLDNIAEEAESC